MKNMPHVVSVMTPFPHSIEAGKSLHEANTMMLIGEVRHLPVVDGNNLIGIISDRDIKLTLSVCKDEELAKQLRVSDACNFEAYIVDANTRLDTVVGEMAERKIGSALVTKNGKLVGIFTTTDACKQLSDLLKLHYPDA